MDMPHNDRQPPLLLQTKERNKQTLRPGTSRGSTSWISTLSSKELALDSTQPIINKARSSQDDATITSTASPLAQHSVAESRIYKPQHSVAASITLPPTSHDSLLELKSTTHAPCIEAQKNNATAAVIPSTSTTQEEQPTSILRLSFSVDVYVPSSVLYAINTEDIQERIQQRLSKHINAQVEEKIVDAFSSWTTFPPGQMRRTSIRTQDTQVDTSFSTPTPFSSSPHLVGFEEPTTGKDALPRNIDIEDVDTALVGLCDVSEPMPAFFEGQHQSSFSPPCNIFSSLQPADPSLATIPVSHLPLHILASPSARSRSKCVLLSDNALALSAPVHHLQPKPALTRSRSPSNSSDMTLSDFPPGSSTPAAQIGNLQRRLGPSMVTSDLLKPMTPTNHGSILPQYHTSPDPDSTSCSQEVMTISQPIENSAVVNTTQGNQIWLKVRLSDDPDSLEFRELFWEVTTDTPNVLVKYIRVEGYTYWEENGVMTCITGDRKIPWKCLAPYHTGNVPIHLYRRPMSRFDLLLQRGLGMLLCLVGIVVLLLQPWKDAFWTSAFAVLSNILPMLGQWVLRLEKRSGERSIDPYLNSIYQLDPWRLYSMLALGS